MFEVCWPRRHIEGSLLVSANGSGAFHVVYTQGRFTSAREPNGQEACSDGDYTDNGVYKVICKSHGIVVGWATYAVCV